MRTFFKQLRCKFKTGHKPTRNYTIPIYSIGEEYVVKVCEHCGKRITEKKIKTTNK